MLKTEALSIAEWDRRLAFEVPGDPPARIQIATPEDIIIQKLIYRLGEGVSDRQWNDVLGVIRTQADRLDLGYLRRWCAASDVGDLLDEALAEAGLS